MLALPTLQRRDFGSGVVAYTDDVLAHDTKTRIAFFTRVLDCAYVDPSGEIPESTKAISDVFGLAPDSIVRPLQVHGDNLVCITTPEELDQVKADAIQGADGVLVTTLQIGALLGFADCVPVIIVAENGEFAVVHAGWRGVVASIVPKAASALADVTKSSIGDMNFYIGAHIGPECFEVGHDVLDIFTAQFGQSAVYGEDHIDLASCIRKDILAIGADEARIVDLGMCTACNQGEFFSYRVSNGNCGRHGAFAYRA